jgi:hypothetical protein
VQSGINNRSQARSNVFLTASLIAGTVPFAVRVRNLSTRGALLDGTSLPTAGARARLVRGELGVDGHIAWQSNGQAGMRFSGEIDVGAWVKRIGHAGQQRVDETITALRRDQPPPAVCRAQAPSLAAISAELDAICERLAAWPSLTVEMGEEVVRLDALARKLQQLANQD